MKAEEFLQHYGKKGMKWGVRNEQSNLTRTTLKTKYGDSISVDETPPSNIEKIMRSISKTYSKKARAYKNFTIRDSKGKTVGNLATNRDSKDSLNIIWIGINSTARGRGYSQSVMKGVIASSKKKKIKKLTLEVPGNSKDALHIYKKLGFKEVGKPYDLDGSWGGLTDMVLDLK